MRKRFTVLVIAFMLFTLSGCKSLSARGKQLLDNVPSYTRVAEYARNNLAKPEYLTSEGHYMINTGELMNSAEIRDDASVIAKDYSYFWIEKDYVLFWNDETKTEGILYAFDTGNAISSLRATYKDLDIEQLKDKCFLLKQARSYIG